MLRSQIFWGRLHSLMIQELKSSKIDDNVKFYEFVVERATEYDRTHRLRIEAKRESETCMGKSKQVSSTWPWTKFL